VVLPKAQHIGFTFPKILKATSAALPARRKCDLATKQKVRCAATEAKPRLGPVGASERKISDAGPLLGDISFGATLVFARGGAYRSGQPDALAEVTADLL